MSTFDRIKCLAKLSNDQNRLGLEFLDALPGFSKPSFGTIVSGTTMTPVDMEGVYPFLISDAGNLGSWMLGNIVMGRGNSVLISKVKEGAVPLTLGVPHTFSIVNSASCSWSTGISNYPPRSTTDTGLAAGYGALAEGDQAIAIGVFAKTTAADAIAIGSGSSAAYKGIALGAGSVAGGKESVLIGNGMSSSFQSEFRTRKSLIIPLKWLKDTNNNHFHGRKGDNYDEFEWNIFSDLSDYCSYTYIEGEAAFNYGDANDTDTSIYKIILGVTNPGYQPKVLHTSFSELFRGTAGPQMQLSVTAGGFIKAQIISQSGYYDPIGSLVLRCYIHKD